MAGLASLPIKSRPTTLAVLCPTRARALAAVVSGASLLLGLGGCGSGGSHPAHAGAAGTRRARTVHRAAQRPSSAPRLVYRRLFALPAALRDPASAELGHGQFMLIGGLDSADVSSAGIEVARDTGVLHTSTLALAQHDAQGARLGGRVYVFGGGSATELDHILSFDPVTGISRQVGTLPHAQSDVAVTAVGGTAYIVGGYDGVDWLNTILAWRPGAPVKVAGHLPVGLRYAAVAAVDGQVIILGGSTPSAASDAVYRFDPVTGAVRRIGRLPHPITHGAAGTLDGFVYLVGGRGDDLTSQTASVLSVDPRSGVVRTAGTLPQPLSDSGVVSVGGGLVVAGGLTPSATVAQVGRLAPAGQR